jgi:hypothetical protein
MAYFDDIVGEPSYFDDILRPQEPLKDDRNLFAKANDFVIDAGNAVAGLAKAGVSLVSPTGDTAKSLSEFITEGQSNQSDYRQKLRQNLDQLVAEAKERGDTGVLEYLGHALSNPVTVLLPEAVGNFGPFAAAGRVAQVAGAGRAATQGLGVAEQAAAGSRAALGATSTLGGTVGAGGVRGGYADTIMRAPDAQLQAESPEYAALRNQGVDESTAKTEIAGRVDPRLIGGMAAGGGIGVLSGRIGAEGALFGRNPGFARTVGTEVGGEFVEGATQQAAQNYAVQGQLPSQPLGEDVLLGGVQEALISAPGGVVAGAVGRKTPPTPGEVLAEIDSAPTVDDAIMAAGRLVEESLMTAADQPSDVNRMTDEALGRARDFAEGEVAAAEDQMRTTLGTLDEARQDAAFAPQSEAAAQAVRDADAPRIEEAVRQQQVEQAIQAVDAPEPNAMQLALMRAREKADVGERLPAAGNDVGPAVPRDVPQPAPVVPDRPVAVPEQRGQPGSSVGVVGQGGEVATGGQPQPDAARGVQPTGIASPVASPVASPNLDETAPAVPRETWRRVETPTTLSVGTPVRSDTGVGLVVKSPVPLAPGRARIQWSDGTTVTQNVKGLEIQKTPSRVDALQSAERDSQFEEVSDFPTAVAPGKRMISKRGRISSPDWGRRSARRWCSSGRPAGSTSTALSCLTTTRPSTSTPRPLTRTIWWLPVMKSRT